MRIVIVDDEPLARKRLKTLLGTEKGCEVVAECRNGQEAVATINLKKPDLVLLDVQMPMMDGFSVLQALDPHALPAVIFVTAYDQYAIRAFEIHALDYLLKPFDQERFTLAIERARQGLARREKADLNERLLSLLAQLRSTTPQASRIPIKKGDTVYLVAFDDIDWIEANGNYVNLHTASGSHLLRETMKGMEKRLDQQKFRRIHRNVIVNTVRIKELHTWFHGDYKLILTGGKELTVSRRYRRNLDGII